MDDKTFDSLSEYSRKLSFPQGLSGEQIVRGIGDGFKKNERYAALCTIITSRLTKASKPLHKFSSSENFIACGKKLTAKLNSTERLYFFLLMMYGWSHSSENNPQEIEVAAETLDVSEEERITITGFFRADLPFKDTHNTIYFVNEKSNPLIKAAGVNVIYSLNGENEIHCLKYLPKRNLFLVKVLSTHRQANSITETISVKQFNVIDAADSRQPASYKISFDNLRKSVETFLPFQSVKCVAGQNTPAINLDAALSKIQITGSSSPLSPINYFQPVLDWLKLYADYGAEALEIEIKLEYFNSYTLKFLLNLCNECKLISEQGRDISIKWLYDDEEILEFGQQLKEFFGKKFELIEIPNKATALL